MSRPHVIIVCCGLDHARRGYETFARSGFEALRRSPDLKLELLKGSGRRAAGERAVPTLRRDQALVRLLARVSGRPAFRIEALVAAFAMQPALLMRKPQIVYLSEWDTARALAWLRRLTRQSFRILFSNGGFATSGFERFDQVQELTPAGRDYVLARGAEPQKHVLLPYGFDIPDRLQWLSTDSRRALRRQLGLPEQRPVLLSVAALNRSHKRIDYLIEELAAVHRPRPFLAVLGEADHETPTLLRLAEERLGRSDFTMRTVPPSEVRSYLQASDAFVLTSMLEAQGRALVEAMAQGLACIAHDTPIMRFATGDHGILRDLSRPGALTEVIDAGIGTLDEESARIRHRYVYETFSWDCLQERYIELFQRLAAPAPA